MANAKLWFLPMALLPLAVPAMDIQFAGFSTVAVPGDAGLVGLHGACQAAFGNKARMCVADELVRTPEIVGFTQELSAWVQPGSSRFPCSGWASPIGSGTVLDARTMAFANRRCGEALPVTCCQER